MEKEEKELKADAVYFKGDFVTYYWNDANANLVSIIIYLEDPSKTRYTITAKNIFSGNVPLETSIHEVKKYLQGE